MSHSTTSGQILAIAIGSSGALSAVWLQVPIPWLIGSLFFVAIATGIGLPVNKLPPIVERWMRVAIGVSLGPSVAASVSQNTAELPLAITAAVVVTSLTVAFGTKWFEYRTTLPKSSAFLTALPGGLSMLLAMASNTDNRAQVLIAHTVRVVFVVVFVSVLARILGVPANPEPLLASFNWSDGSSPVLLILLIIVCFVLAEKLRWPGIHVILPMIATAILTLTTDLAIASPEIVKTIALLVFGIVLGDEVASGPRETYGRLTTTSILFTVAALSMGAVLAIVLSGFIDQKFLVLFLALAPGGIAEVSLVALALGLDAGLVALVHACRFIFIVSVGPIGLRYFVSQEELPDSGNSPKRRNTG